MRTLLLHYYCSCFQLTVGRVLFCRCCFFFCILKRVFKVLPEFCRDALGQVLLVAAARLGKQHLDSGVVNLLRPPTSVPIVLHLCVSDTGL